MTLDSDGERRLGSESRAAGGESDAGYRGQGFVAAEPASNGHGHVTVGVSIRFPRPRLLTALSGGKAENGTRTEPWGVPGSKPWCDLSRQKCGRRLEL